MEKTNDVEEDFYAEAFSRNIGLFSPKEQGILRESTVAIAGLGGVGGNYCLSLARTGVGGFSLADFDTFELANTNRQAGADTQSMGREKCIVMAEKVRLINPHARIRQFNKGISSENVDEFLEGAKVVLDGLDFFAIRERVMLFKKAREKGIFAITSPPIGFGAALLVFDPKGMNFEEYFDICDGMDEKEMLFRFGLGLSPSLIQRKYFKPESIDFSGKKTPSLGIGTQACNNLVCCETAKVILGKRVRSVPFSTHFDPYVQKYKKITLWGGNRNPKQLLKRIIFRKILKKKGMI